MTYLWHVLLTVWHPDKTSSVSWCVLTSWRIFDIMKNFLMSWHVFDVMKCFWHHDSLTNFLTSMTCFLMLWRTFDVRTYFWHNDLLLTFLTSWHISDIMPCSWRHDVLLLTWQTFWWHDVFLTSWHIFCIVWWCHIHHEVMKLTNLRNARTSYKYYIGDTIVFKSMMPRRLVWINSPLF